jgi:SAM-dependent methyltransferase
MSTTSTPFTSVPPDHPSYAGQATYTSRFLRIYDPFVVRFSGRFVYRCPSGHIRRLYARHAGDRHLDLGPGSGYFLDRCRWSSEWPALTLVDLNPDVLRYAAHRLRRFAPRTLQADVLEPLPLERGGFDSIGMNYLLHCVPGTMSRKAEMFPGLARLLAPGGVLFGSTAVTDSEEQGWLERRLVPLYNRKGILSNTGDSVADLEAGLRRAFATVTVERRGSIAMFVATDAR